MTIDPADARTVYAAVGGYGRRWIPPGSLGDDTSKVGTGHLFVSHDAGEHFTDISGNLPDLPADAVLIRGTSLLVVTDNGVFTTAKARPGTYAALAKGLPAAPVVSLQNSPRNGREVVAASYGRGVYTVLLPDSVTPAGAGTGAGAGSGAGGGPASGGTGAGSGAGSAPGNGRLAATGLPLGLTLTGGLLLGAALLLRRHRTSRAAWQHHVA